MGSQSGIFAMFARSPITPLQRHMAQAQTAAALLLPFFEAVEKKDWATAENLRQLISNHEHQADKLKMDFRLHLPKGIFMPFSRADLLDLLTKQEQIANIAKDIAGIVNGRKMSFPGILQPKFNEYVKRVIDATNQAQQAISELDELLESGFRGPEVSLVDSMIQELNVIEHDTDELQIELRQKIFSLEHDLAPVDVMFLYKIFELIGALADSAQQSGHQLQMLIAD